MSELAIYGLQTFRNAIGDIEVPKYDHWKRELTNCGHRGCLLPEDHPEYIEGGNNLRDLGVIDRYFAVGMIGVIWATFLALNVILLLVILMNFLIAIVADTYVLCQQQATNNTYYFRSELNLEYLEIFGEASFKRRFNFILFQESAGETHRGQTVMEMLKHTRKAILSTAEHQSDVQNGKLARIHKDVLDTRHDLTEKVESYQARQSEAIETLKGQMSSLT